jgi:hypothetical protein
MSRTRYNLKIPTETYKNLQKIARQEGTTVAELLRRATKLLLYVRSIKDNADGRLLVERGDEVQEIVLGFI